MIVNLSNHELELLEKALDAYEKEVCSNAMFTGMLTTIFTPKEECEEGENSPMRKAARQAELETRQRRVETTLLRAKLYQTMAKESEHTLEKEVAS